MDFPGKETKKLSLSGVWFPYPSADKPNGWCWLVIILHSVQEAKGKWPVSTQIIKLATATFHCWLPICISAFLKPFFTLENPKENEKYIQELKADSINFLSCRCFMKICTKIMGKTHTNACKGKYHSSVLCGKYIYLVYHMNCLKDGRLHL